MATSSAMAAAQLATFAKLDMVRVPHKGEGPATIDLLSRRVLFQRRSNSRISSLRIQSVRRLGSIGLQKVLLCRDPRAVADPLGSRLSPTVARPAIDVRLFQVLSSCLNIG